MENTFDVQTTVISTRIRLARNFAAYPFPKKMDESQAEDLVYLVGAGLKKFKGFTKHEVRDLSHREAELLREQYLISPALLKSKRGAAFISQDKAISVMVNEEDHLRQQCILQGFDLYGAYECVSRIDNWLSSVYDFAFDERLGYLTACPSNLGTGMRASVMMFLPGLTQNGGLKRLLPELKRSGLTVRGAFGEGSTSDGWVYQVSNERTLGISEIEILESVTATANRLCDLEKQAREDMLRRSALELRDRCLRAFGTLTYCALLTEKELFSLLAEVRLGVALGFLKTVGGEDFDEFYTDMQPATFKISNHLERMSERKCNEVRAETVRSILPQLVCVNKTEEEKSVLANGQGKK